jgi:hypothetical protein
MQIILANTVEIRKTKRRERRFNILPVFNYGEGGWEGVAGGGRWRLTPVYTRWGAGCGGSSTVQFFLFFNGKGNLTIPE